ELRGHRRICGGGGDDDAGLDAATGCVPASAVGQVGKYRDVGLGDRRFAVSGVCFRADIPCLFGNADRPRNGGASDGGGFTEDIADTGVDQGAADRTDPVFRRTSVSDQELCVGDVAGAVGDLHREHHQADVSAHDR